MAKKQKFTVYANCQSDALANLLLRNPFFADEYELLRILPVHLLQKKHTPSVREKVSQVGLCISQPVSKANGSRLSTEEVADSLQANSKLLTFPSIYFDGYFPHLVPIANMPSIMNNAHDINIMVLNQKGYSASEIFEITSGDDFYNSALSDTLFEKSIEALQVRENTSSVNITVSDFILAHYRESILFNTYNHPSNKILMHIASRVCEMLNIDNSIYAELNAPEILGSYRAMPYLSTFKNLQLSDSIKTSYYLEGKDVSHRDVVTALTATYSKHVNEKVLSVAGKKAPLVVKNLEKY
ncbi:MAG: hypothetical protein ACI8ZM_005543 [Crocinitomix sp.]|jgi:hypothetical protein